MDENFKSPVRPYRTIIANSGDPGYVNRILVATPTTGLVRIEWVQARYGQTTPVNWSMVQYLRYMDSFIPLRYQVADAQNLIVTEAIEKDFEWLFFVEHDVILPPDTFIKLNRYMSDERVPIVSGLYYTRSRPSLPLIFRGRGVGSYEDFEIGDMVWADGVPTGCLLVHMGIMRELWKDSEEYNVPYMGGQKSIRRVFNEPRKSWFDPESGQYNAMTGTSDLEWCTRIIEGNYFEKSGWDFYADKRYPFLVDTSIFCKHINPDGEIFPPSTRGKNG